MTMRFYSATTGGFYSEAVHGPRQIAQAQTAREVKAGKRPAMIPNPACTIPEDAVPVSAERYAELLAAQGTANGTALAGDAGKQIVAVNGKPMARDREADPAERIAARRRKRDRLLADSDWTQLPDAQPVGGTKAWTAYRQDLRDLDMSASDWPQVPGEPAPGSIS
jgi:Phage tail assembly chaperone protein